MLKQLAIWPALSALRIPLSLQKSGECGTLEGGFSMQTENGRYGLCFQIVLWTLRVPCPGDYLLEGTLTAMSVSEQVPYELSKCLDTAAVFGC